MILILLSSLVFVASADDPQPCCLPIRYSSRMIQVGGSVALGPNPQGQMIDNILELHYDYSKTKMAVISHSLDQNTGVRGNATVIFDYGDSKMHVVTAGGKCETSQIDPNSMPHPCLTKLDNVTYTGSYSIGSSLKPFNANTFSGTVGGAYMVSLAVTNDCTPVAESVYGSDGKTASLNAYLFSDFSRSYVDDNLFIVPQQCKIPASGVGVGRRDLEVLKIDRLPFDYN